MAKPYLLMFALVFVPGCGACGGILRSKKALQETLQRDKVPQLVANCWPIQLRCTGRSLVAIIWRIMFAHKDALCEQQLLRDARYGRSWQYYCVDSIDAAPTSPAVL